MRTLIFPLGSNPSNWLISSNIVRCTSLELPSPSLNLVPKMEMKTQIALMAREKEGEAEGEEEGALRVWEGGL